MFKFISNVISKLINFVKSIKWLLIILLLIILIKYSYNYYQNRSINVNKSNNNFENVNENNYSLEDTLQPLPTMNKDVSEQPDFDRMNTVEQQEYIDGIEERSDRRINRM